MPTRQMAIEVIGRRPSGHNQNDGFHETNVLIVDDEAGVRSALSGVLRDEGYAVDAVDSGEACLDRVVAQPTTSSCSTSGCPG